MKVDDVMNTGTWTPSGRDALDTGLRWNRWDLLTTFVALVLYAVGWPTFFITHDLGPVFVPFVAAIGTLPVAVLRHAPIVAWGCVAAASLMAVPFHANDGFALGWPVAFHLALAVTLAAVVLAERWTALVWAVGLTTALMALNPADVRAGWMFGVLVMSAFLLLARWLVVSRRQLRSSTVQLVQESARSTEQADLRVLAEERNRLARDLHDVVAHQMSMIVVQSQSAPYRLQGVTPGIHAEFDSISETARSALDEVRGLLGVLRSDADQGAVDPVGMDQIEPTLQAARRSGVDITWQILGETDRVDETAGVVLHRVLQESLSNATRHAPGGLVVVTLTVGEDDTADTDTGGAPIAAARAVSNGTVTIEVDNGPADPDAIVAPGTGGGSGIRGMSARVGAVGGSFSAVPAGDGGFTVTATVPVRDGGRRRTRLG